MAMATVKNTVKRKELHWTTIPAPSEWYLVQAVFGDEEHPKKVTNTVMEPVIAFAVGIDPGMNFPDEQFGASVIALGFECNSDREDVAVRRPDGDIFLQMDQSFGSTQELIDHWNNESLPKEDGE